MKLSGFCLMGESVLSCLQITKIKKNGELNSSPWTTILVEDLEFDNIARKMALGPLSANPSHLFPSSTSVRTKQNN